MTAARFLNTPIKHEACLVKLLWHPLSKSLPCLGEAEKQMSWVCLPLMDRAVKTCSWRTLKTAQMERMSYLRFSLFLCQEWASWWETVNSLGGSFCLQSCAHHKIILFMWKKCFKSAYKCITYLLYCSIQAATCSSCLSKIWWCHDHPQNSIML